MTDLGGDQRADWVIAPPRQAWVPIAGGGRFPVRRVYCVGRNYAEHIREMGGDERQPPFFFQKPADAIVHDGAAVPYPTLTKDLQHEIELVLAIRTGGSAIAEADAAAHVFGLAVGIDLTRRDLQVEARKAGRPWEIGKAFDHSAPIGLLRPLAGAALPVSGAISINVNGETRQQADLGDMTWNAAEIVAQLSRHYRLEPGDLIYTGTPAGVTAVAVGDRLEGRVADLPPLRITIAAPEDEAAPAERMLADPA
ncbi:fumarylacetoacetate hydrolase family protein [Sphingomonas sp.]|uniref:fumarylacetoacetate hydrolase family protein n=1 Tax=Sphingomonas sp. TaxID=28214 RepID=UPI002FCA5966